MGYAKATEVLPHSLLAALQEYIDGAYLYIPRKDGMKKAWGEVTRTRQELRARNAEIACRYREGCPVPTLARQYCLSAKTIYKILAAGHSGP